MAAPAAAPQTPQPAAPPPQAPVQQAPADAPPQQAPAQQQAQGPQGQNAARGSCSLYVGDLPTDLPTPEDALFNLFSKIGMVMSIKVCRDINTQRSLGYAYVNFQNPADAEQALQRLNFTEIRPGRPIRVMWSIRDPAVRKSGSGNIFVKNLDPSIDNRTLHDTFAVFGNIFSCKIATDDQGKSLGYGFVHFETEEAATAAIGGVDGMQIGGKDVSVVPFIKKSDRDEHDKQIFTNIYLKNLKADCTEEEIQKLLGGYGTIQSVFLGEAQKYNTKFALVVMEEHESAVDAIEKLHENESPVCDPDQKLYVARAMKKRERAAARSRASANNLYQSQGRNVYVKHIDDTMNSEQFKELFMQFGDITSAKLMSGEDGQMRGFGFVCFTSKEAASAAIREMNGKMIGRRPLYVSQAQQRDMRHHMLDEQRKAMMQQQHRMAMNLGPQGFGWDGRGFGMGRGGFGPGGGRGAGMPPMGGGFPMGGFPPMMPGMGRGMNRGMPRGGGGGGGGGFPGGPMGGNFGVPPMHRGQFTQPPPMNRPAPSSALPGGLSSADLSKLPPEEQKNALGEKLYVKIQELNPNQAPKITGMLLEMDIPEILNVLEDRGTLVMKVREAESVLSRHDKH